jgi:hypothetical protein
MASRGPRTPHRCADNMTTVAEAARASGQQYQYVYGMAQRNWNSKRPNITATIVVEPYTQKTKYRVCQICVTDYYGKAGSNAPQEVLVATPFIGYRSWSIVSNQLCSWYSPDFPWLPGPSGTEAKCDRPRATHKPPGVRCKCGLYALNDPTQVPKGDVLGQVKLWGRFVKGDMGFKGQFGRPTALLCDNFRVADKIHFVAELYRIPVTHSLDLLQKTDWRAYVKGGEFNHEHWRDPAGGRGDAGRDRTGPDGGADTGLDPRSGGPGAGVAACRRAARACRDVIELKFLLQAGEISDSNILEILHDPTNRIGE